MKASIKKQSCWCWRNEEKKRQLRENLKNRFGRGEVDWIHAGYFNLYPWLCKRSITLSFIMDCEKCDWTSMEKKEDLWSDGAVIRVINICCMAGRLMDALLTSAVSWELDISTFQKPRSHYSISCCNYVFIQSTLGSHLNATSQIIDGNSSSCKRTIQYIVCKIIN